MRLFRAWQPAGDTGLPSEDALVFAAVSTVFLPSQVRIIVGGDRVDSCAPVNNPYCGGLIVNTRVAYVVIILHASALSPPRSEIKNHQRGNVFV